tara:strand:+ start:27007 stop:27897 length:891 start_codon:yes stop_codon:yes gene_type:complete
MNYPIFTGLLTAAVACSCYGSITNTINIENGQVLGVADLAAGTFNGTSFTINSSLVININDGGTMGSVDEYLGDWSGFSLSNATININSGGRLEGAADQIQLSTTILSRARINLNENGSIGNLLIRGNGLSTLNLYGGITDQVVVDSPGFVRISGGIHHSLGGFAQAHNELTTEILDGEIYGIGLRGNDRIDLRGGRIHSIGAVGGTLNIFGDELIIDGIAIDLALNETVELNTGIFDFDVLSGTLEDGSFFEFDQYREDIFIGATTNVYFTRTVPTMPTTAIFASGLIALTKRRR